MSSFRLMRIFFQSNLFHYLCWVWVRAGCLWKGALKTYSTQPTIKERGAHTIQCYCRHRFLFLLSLGWISLSPVFCTACQYIDCDIFVGKKKIIGRVRSIVISKLTVFSAPASWKKERGEEAHVRSAVQGLPHTSSPVSYSRSSCRASTSLSFSIWFDVFTTS